MSILAVAALAAMAVWLGLLAFRSGFWRADQRLVADSGARTAWPAVASVVPARNEADHVGQAVAALLAQDYGGDFRVVVVDDGSEDGTADAARAAGPRDGRLEVIPGRPLAAGWAGKMWAVSQGLDHAAVVSAEARYVLLSDADVVLAPDQLSGLVAKAEDEGLDLVSLMVRLNCTAPWERLLIPAFVFFFQKLYPFPAVNDPARRTAAAAGGCMLVRRDALDRIGGIAAIRDRVIDDCALAAAIKKGGRIWLGLADTSKSLRAYDSLGGIWRMVARTAFTQLDHSVFRLIATVAALVLVYMVPPVAAIAGLVTGDAVALGAGAAAWSAMALGYRPTVAYYGVAAGYAWLLPVAAILYVCMTVDSAAGGLAGGGNSWKGRSYQPRRGGK